MIDNEKILLVIVTQVISMFLLTVILNIFFSLIYLLFLGALGNLHFLDTP